MIIDRNREYLQGNFTQISNDVLNSKNLSLKAKGLYTFLCSKPRDWKFSYDGLSSQLQDGKKSIRSGVKELVDNKLLIRISKKTGSNFVGWDWIINPTNDDLINHTDPTNRKLLNKTQSIQPKQKPILKTNESKPAKKLIKKDSQESANGFEEFWVKYKRKGSKKKGLEQWKKLSDKEKQTANRSLRHLFKEKTEVRYLKDVERYLRDNLFDDVMERKRNDQLIINKTNFGSTTSKMNACQIPDYFTIGQENLFDEIIKDPDFIDDEILKTPSLLKTFNFINKISYNNYKKSPVNNTLLQYTMFTLKEIYSFDYGVGFCDENTIYMTTSNDMITTYLEYLEREFTKPTWTPRIDQLVYNGKVFTEWFYQHANLARPGSQDYDYLFEQFKFKELEVDNPQQKYKKEYHNENEWMKQISKKNLVE